MEWPYSLSSAFLPFPDHCISSNLAPIEEERVTTETKHAYVHELAVESGSEELKDSDTAPPKKRSKGSFSCAPCGKAYTESRALARHKHTASHRRLFGLPPLDKFCCAHTQCQKTFTRKSDRKRHELEAHDGRRRPPVATRSALKDLRAKRENSLDTSVKYVQNRTFMVDDDATSPQHSWSQLVPWTEVFPGPANWGAGVVQTPSDLRTEPTRATFPAAESALLHDDAGLRTECPISPSLATYRDSHSWFDDGDSDTEHDRDEKILDEGMEPRPETQLSVKTTKSSNADSAIDLSDDQPHEPKRPSITTYDYRKDRDDSADPTKSDLGVADEVEPQPILPLPPRTSIIHKPGKAAAVPVRTPTLCVFCDRPFPVDEAALMIHLRQHLHALRGDRPNKCHACDVGFVHKADLDKHLSSAKHLSHCGFHFDHQSPCTGHHSAPEGLPDPVLTDRDRFLLCEQLRHWEIWQLRVYMEDIKHFAAKRDCETSTTYSVDALFKRSRASMSSFAVSIDTHGSAPCDRASGGQLDIGGIRHRMKMMSLKGSSIQVRDRAKKLPQIMRSGGSTNKALYNAVVSGDHSQVRLFLTMGKDVNAVFGEQSVLSAAAQYADLPMVKLLVELGASVHTPERKFGSAIASAAHAGKGDVCELLLAHGANVLQAGGKYGCALSAAAAAGHVGLAALLLEHGADVSQRAGALISPISTAGAYGRTAMVRFLLDHGADVNHAGGDEGSPLGFAVAYGHVRTAGTLIERGADVNAVSMKHGSVLTIAILKVARREHSLDMVRLLLKTGASANPPGSYNPLRVAAANADVEAMVDVVRLLLDYGASPDAKGHGGTALQLANKARDKWIEKKPFLSIAQNVENVDDTIGFCYEVIGLLKKAGAADGRRTSSSSRTDADGLFTRRRSSFQRGPSAEDISGLSTVLQDRCCA